MPVVTVYGVPQHVSSHTINTEFRPELKRAMAGVTELHIPTKNISVFVCKENTENSSPAIRQNDIVVFIDLFERPERTDELLNALCKAVVNKIQEFPFSRGALIECFCRFINPMKGFWSSEM